jgi:cation diffusion facilitator CzcD-associated flavoprotein CzcO
MTQDRTRLLVIGAGPFGLSLGAYADDLGIDTRIHGHSMSFWREHMPDGMLLRSACDWHLDATGRDSIETYLHTLGLRPSDVEPLSLPFYLSYVEWFEQRRGLRPDPRLVVALDRQDGLFRARLEDRTTLVADNVVLALGFRHFQHVPDDLAAVLPEGRYQHTCELVDLTRSAGRRVLVVGGRQSAFEWAALLHEAGAVSLDVCHRHASPAFATADWSWVAPLVDGMVGDPGWYRHLTAGEKDDVNQRLWAEGRLKVEPWLEDRLTEDSVRIRPFSRVVGCEEVAGGDLEVRLDDGATLRVDDIVLATGYRPDVTRIPLLVAGNVLPALETRNGLPVLDESFQTSVPGLFATSMLAVQDFGPFFAFTGAVRTSTRLIGDALARHPRPLAGAG